MWMLPMYLHVNQKSDDDDDDEDDHIYFNRKLLDYKLDISLNFLGENSRKMSIHTLWKIGRFPDLLHANTKLPRLNKSFLCKCYHVYPNMPEKTF